jgi:hypothetical protein
MCPYSNILLEITTAQKNPIIIKDPVEMKTPLNN